MKSKIICQLEKELDSCGKLIVLDTKNYEFRTDLILAIMEKCSQNAECRVKIWTEKNNAETDNSCKVLTKDEFLEVKNFYYTYEFTNKMIYISDGCEYGGLNNFFNQGILSIEEIVLALLR